MTGRLPDLRRDHNAWYHRSVLRRLPAGCTTVLDVGCGTGALAAALAGRCPAGRRPRPRPAHDRRGPGVGA